MKKVLFALACLLACAVGGAKEKAPEVTDLGIVGEGIGNGSAAIVTATCSAKKADKVTDADIARAAVRGVLFTGWTDKAGDAYIDSATKHPAVAGSADAEVQHADYFKAFFESNAPMSYVTILPDTRKVVKSGKVYKVSQTVTVNTSALKAKLQKDGVIKGLRSGW